MEDSLRRNDLFGLKVTLAKCEIVLPGIRRERLNTKRRASRKMYWNLEVYSYREFLNGVGNMYRFHKVGPAVGCMCHIY